VQSVALTPELRSTRIGFGCAGLMRDPTRKGRQAVLEAAFEQGIRHFDVARMYGLGMAERELGRFVGGHRREELVIVSKFGIEASSAPAGLARLQGPARRLLARYPALRGYVKRRSRTLHSSGHYDAQSARESLETSLRELGTDHIDVLLLHDPPPQAAIELDELGAYLESARAAGYIKAWGVAGEREGSEGLEQALPGSTILQVRRDIFTGGHTAPKEGGSLITFGVLSGALDRIVAHAGASPERRARWSEQVGSDCADPRAVARLLLGEALLANPDGVVLFSTTKARRLEGLDALVRSAGALDSSLSALRRLVAEEQTLLSAVAAG
jgi:D-threo-aldose 1-dehydrogenase